MGQTLAGLLQNCQLSQDQLPLLTKTLVKQKCEYFATPASEVWRAEVIKECLEILSGEIEVPNFDPEEFRGLVDTLCTDRHKVRNEQKLIYLYFLLLYLYYTIILYVY